MRTRRELRILLTLIPLVMATGCAATFEVVRAPTRDADLFPKSQRVGRTIVAIYAITDAGLARRYFGTELVERGVVPVQVIVSNHGEKPISTRPADVLALRGQEVVDPVPLATIVALASRDDPRAWPDTRGP